MSKRKIAKGAVATGATGRVDRRGHCYNEEEQASGFFTMIDDNLALPFAIRILGVEVSVVAAEMYDEGGLKAVCEQGGEQQRIGLTDLPLPSQPPSGAEWIAAYRRWVQGR